MSAPECNEANDGKRHGCQICKCWTDTVTGVKQCHYFSHEALNACEECTVAGGGNKFIIFEKFKPCKICRSESYIDSGKPRSRANWSDKPLSAHCEKCVPNGDDEKWEYQCDENIEDCKNGKCVPYCEVPCNTYKCEVCYYTDGSRTATECKKTCTDRLWYCKSGDCVCRFCAYSEICDEPRVRCPASRPKVNEECICYCDVKPEDCTDPKKPYDKNTCSCRYRIIERTFGLLVP